MSEMRRYGIWLLLLGAILLLAGCSVAKKQSDQHQDLECTVLKEDEIPQPLAEVIEGNKTKEMKLSYEKDGLLYIARGFGEQKTGGYSITTKYCYLDEDGIHIRFELLGPSTGETLPEEATWPYIVVRLEKTGESILFE